MSLEYFYNHTLEDLSTLHNNVYQHQSKASKAIFKSTLVRIEKLYGDKLENLKMDFAQDVQEFYNKLNTTKYSENTKLQTISVVIKILRIIDAPLSLINSYINFHKQKSHANAEIKKLEIQKENSIVPSFEDLQDNYIGIMDYYLDGERTYNEFLKYLILGLFVLQPPLRGSNYLNCKLIVKKDVPDDTTHNYLMLDNNKFVFVYNTSRRGSLLPQRLNPVVNQFLTKILNHYVDKFYIDNGNRWFLKNYNGREISNRVIENTIKEMSSIVFDNEITIDDLRASYMKHIYINEKDLLNNIEVIQLLGLQNIPNYLK
tara:strand:- start:12 stop:959 length:948 start_codon:yes stop_codon:yes gene_type:complete